MSELRTSPAVYGIETEYSCMITLPDDVVHEIVGSCHSVDAKIGLYQEPTEKGSDVLSHKEVAHALEDMGIYTTHTGMLSNGGRFYIDPSGPEYATPETSSAKETVERTFDGDTILLGIFERLRQQEKVTGYQLNRRIVDHNRSSRGIHLNTITQLTNREPNDLVTNWLATLNVAKGAIFGSGGLLVDESGDTHYHHSPRLSVTNHLSAPYNYFQRRPLVRYPFKSEGKRMARIETVTSDALNFAWPLRASLVATNALTGIIELGYGDKLPRLDDPVQAAELVGQYGSECMVGVLTKEGNHEGAYPLDIIRNICEVVLEAASKHQHLDKESDQVIREIIEVADKMADDPFSVADQVESIGRLVAMERKMEKDGLKLDSEKMCRFDYAWDWIGGGIAETLRNKGLVGWQGFGSLPPASVSRKRLIQPPQDTRAKVRGEAIKQTKGSNYSSWQDIDWEGDQNYISPLATRLPID
jgi:hypothetical protein